MLLDGMSRGPLYKLARRVEAAAYAGILKEELIDLSATPDEDPGETPKIAPVRGNTVLLVMLLAALVVTMLAALMIFRPR